MLLRFRLQPCSLSKPFNEMAVGFYIHTDMNFVVTENKDLATSNDFGYETAAAL